MCNTNIFQGTQLEQRHMEIGSSVVLGNQWGDEGKGKITDILAQMSDVIIRFNGGHNAGHTVKVGNKAFDLHILPSGIVSEGKINIITSGCVLGIHLNKVNIDAIHVSEYGVHCDLTLEQIIKREKGKKIEVGLIPELEKLRQGGVNIKKSQLKISGEVPVIGMHNVFLDAYDEKRRKPPLRTIGSTGSGISRGYTAGPLRQHFTLNDLIYNEDSFYASIEDIWGTCKNVFPNITVDELIQKARQERSSIIKYCKNREIEIIPDESQYIKWLHKKNFKIIGEGAQASMIGSANSLYGTASDPSLERFLTVSGLTAQKVGNIILIHKVPPSSVGTRPGLLQYLPSPYLDWYRKEYKEYGVSTGRPRDLFYPSLPETAKGAGLSVRGVDDESKIVCVFNRVDGLEDAMKLDHKGVLRIVKGYSYIINDILGSGGNKKIKVGLQDNESVTIANLLRNYPEKSMQEKLFDVSHSDLNFIDLSGAVEEQKEKFLALHLSAIYKKDQEREFFVGTGPCRSDLEIRKGVPIRDLNSL